MLNLLPPRVPQSSSKLLVIGSSILLLVVKLFFILVIVSSYRIFTENSISLDIATLGEGLR
jgi:hypothetical protein